MTGKDFFVCASLFDEDLPGLFVHCIHGLGHGAMASGILLAMDQGYWVVD